MSAKRTWGLAALAAAAVLAAVALRFAALGEGLPRVFAADEPAFVSQAAAVASGSLRPASFKHPALWPTLLAGLYGLWFALWSGFGLLRGPLDFAALYGFDPSSFLLIARGAAACASVAALWVVLKAERARDKGRWPYGALALAFAPAVVELARSARPDSLALLASAGAWACALRFQAGGARGWLLAAGALAGAASSTLYAAAPAALVVPLAWALREGGRAPAAWLAQSALCAAGAFLAGSPYTAVDFGRFLAERRDEGDLARLRPHDAALAARAAAGALWSWAGEGSPAGPAAAAGLVYAARRAPRRAALLAVPVLVSAAALAAGSDAGVRGLAGALPGLALLAGEGAAAAGGASAWRRTAIAVLLAAPGLALSWSLLAEARRPDTRALAADWLAANVPGGETVLLDAPHVSPRALSSKAQCLELASRAAASGSARARLWSAMAERHPGGGWRVYRIRRSAAPPSDGEFLDVRPGLDPVRAVRARWVVTSSLGANPRHSRELATFFSELAAGAELVKEFAYEPGRVGGPWLRVWRLSR